MTSTLSSTLIAGHRFVVAVTRTSSPVLALFLVLAGAAFGQSVYSNPYTFTTFAGRAANGSEDGPGVAARFNNPYGVAVDGTGNLYVADTFNHTIRKISPGGVVTTVAGSTGVSGSSDGVGVAARFYYPSGVAVDGVGNIYVADQENYTVRKITPQGIVTTLAGTVGILGSADGTGSSAQFSIPSDVAVDGAGNVYVADSGNHTIRKITPAGAVSTLAGAAGSSGSTDATGSAARFNNPTGVDVDSMGNVYVADSNNGTIRKITAAGVVTTVAGSAGNDGTNDGTGAAAKFSHPRDVGISAAGDLYVADWWNCTIRKITPAGLVSTLAGVATRSGSADGSGGAALFSSPTGLAVSGSGDIYVADNSNSTIRKITGTGVVTSVAGTAGSVNSTDGTGSVARFSEPMGIATDQSGNLYVADSYNSLIRQITSTGVVTTFAGTAGQSGFADGTGSAAQFSLPPGLAVDRAGNLYVADIYNNVIRKITPSGVVTTLAGSPSNYGYVDGLGSAASFTLTMGVAVDGAGNVYVADRDSNTIRKISPAGDVTTFAGIGFVFGSSDGTGPAASFNKPSGVAVDGAGNLYVADTVNNTIRKITPGRVVTTLAGTAGTSGSADGTGSAARFNAPIGLAVDNAGNVFVADSMNNMIRRITPAGVVSTVGGSVPIGFGPYEGTDGTGAVARFSSPTGLAFDAAGNLYVADSNNNTIRKGVSAADGPAVVAQSPTRNVLNAGQTVSLSVTALGTGSLSYQWYHNGRSISGATAANYTSGALVTADTGAYWVAVTDDLGTRRQNFFVTVAPLVTKVTAWGMGGRGETDVPAGLSDAVSISTAPAGYSLAVKRTGTVVAWGPNDWGQTNLPAGLSDVVAVSAGDFFAAALKSDGTVVAWGTESATETDVPAGLSGVVAIAAGQYHTLALKNDGTVVAWGYNLNGQASVPPGLSDVVAVFARASYSVALKRDGTLVHWGASSAFAGDPPAGLGSVATVSFDFYHGLAAKYDGTVTSWGSDLRVNRTTVPAGLAGVTEVANGTNHSLALNNLGGVVGWGVFSSGQSAAAPAGLANAFAIAAAGDHSLALSDPAIPAIVAQPASLALSNGYSVNLSVSATGIPAPTYQWQKNGVNISGATGTSLSLTNISSGDAGSYRVIASNSLGSTTSDAAVVAVIPAVASAAATTGDFDQDGQSDLVWQNTLTGERSFWLMNGTILKQGVSLGTFAPDWTIVGSGDFNGDGQADLLWQNTITGERSIWLMNGTQLTLGVDLGTYSTDLMIVASGDFNGDGHTDIVWQNIATGERGIWLMTGATKTGDASLGLVPTAWSIAGAGDFNGDGKVDLIWQNDATGERSVWLMNGVTKSSEVSLGLVDKAFQIVGTGDYNRDGKIDVVWTNTETGERSIWLMNGLVPASTVTFTLVSVEWSLARPIFLTSQVARADFDGDGQTDIVWQNSATGERTISLMNGTALASTVSLGLTSGNWVISGVGDFNHDDKPDIVWSNTATGERSLWLMDGTTMLSNVSLATIPTNWVISAIGDFNYDGKPDLVWTNTTTGERSIWLMNGTVFGSGIALGTIPSAWTIATTADLNGDGKTDLIWQNKSTGECSVWLMNGGTFTAGVALDPLPAQWSIVGSGDFNGDGKADLLLENAVTGEKVVRLMNRTTYLSTISLGTFSTNWLIKN